VSKIDGPGLAATSIGAIFIYGGIKGYSPLKAFENVIKGRHPNEGQSNLSLVAADTSASNTNQFGGGTFTGGGNAAQNRALGKMMAAARGWTGAEWDALDKLWGTYESGWRTDANNPGSGAYGIPQALPGSKMASAGADWKTNPVTQIRWGLDYIAGRYGSPSKALAFELSHSPHWY
jgi:hypothetical protein